MSVQRLSVNFIKIGLIFFEKYEKNQRAKYFYYPLYTYMCVYILIIMSCR